MESVNHHLGMGELASGCLIIGPPHVYGDKTDRFSPLGTQSFDPILQRLFLPVRQHCEDAFSGNIRNHEHELLVTLFEGNFINSQHPGRIDNSGAFFQCCKTVEYLFNRRMTQTLTHSNGLAGPSEAGLINMHLEGCGLPAMGIHEGQFLSKSTTIMFASETPRQEMQKGLFAPHIQMSDAPMLFLVNFR